MLFLLILIFMSSFKFIFLFDTSWRVCLFRVNDDNWVNGCECDDTTFVRFAFSSADLARFARQR